ncbi:site-specific integrase [Flagellimonas flava]|uniref:Site-specific recombinase XerD n=1 Tax=Flagellimonas flava TaxID=570519 RepID=A0A1M5NIY2_9FLAO|nr:site-specific integrase [Allomuricauda flava]SHG89544.1 Site-specific recombinase XerD [Allomuricauda flava]
MVSTFSTLFYIKNERRDKNGKAGLYLRITVDGRRTSISLHRKVDPSKWDSRMNKLKGKGVEAEELNRFMTTIRHKINRIQHELIEGGKPFTALDVKNIYLGKDKEVKMLLVVFDEHNRQMKKLVDKEFAIGTWKRYFTTRNHIAEFIRHEYKREDLPFQDVDLKFITRFEYFMKSVKDCNHNSALKYINNFKKIVRLAVANGWIARDPFYNYKVKFKWVDREFLSTEELQRLVDLEINWPRIDMVRDMFVFCCYTGLAYIDVKNLTQDNLVRNIDGELWIEAKRTKTDAKFSIPLLPNALAILAKHKHHPKVMNGECVLPILSNQKSNAYLKEIADLCGIKKNLTTHLARHTFATTVTLSNGVPIETVGKMLGHKNLRATQHYAKIINKKVGEDMAILKEKLTSAEVNKKTSN